MLEGKKILPDNFRRMKGSEVTVEWLESDENAMKVPIVIENPEGLGMKMPNSDFTVDDVAEMVGENTPVEVMGECRDRHAFVDCSCVLARRRLTVRLSRLDIGQVGRVLRHGARATR